MAKLIIKPDPLKNEKEVIEIKGMLVASLVTIYPNGFPTTVRIYKDIPTESTEIDLTKLEDDIKLEDDDIYWLCMFPQGLEVGVFLFVVAIGGLAYKQYGDAINAEIQMEKLEEELSKLSNIEVVEETDADLFLPGVGNSSNNVISSQGNLIRLGQKIPQIYGYVRSFPDLIGDAYDYYETTTENMGDQTLEQYFSIAADKISLNNVINASTNPPLKLATDFRIGNQPIKLESVATLNNDGGYEVYHPGQAFIYNDYISNYKSTDIQSCFPTLFRGNCCVCNPGYSTGTNLSISVSVGSNGRGIVRISSNDGLGDIQFGPYGIFIAMANGNYKAGDRLRLWYGSFGSTPFNGTFRTVGHRMGYITNSPGNHFIEFEVFEATGDYLNVDSTFSISNGRLFLGNETGTLKGNYFWDGTYNSSGTPGVVVPSNRKDFFALNKRKQEGTLKEFIIINLDFPRGFDVKRGSSTITGNPPTTTYLVQFELRFFEIDDNANIILPLFGGNPYHVSLSIPTTSTRATIKFPTQFTIGSVAGRGLGVEITRVDSIYPRYTPFTNTDDQDIRIPTTIEARYVDVGYLVERQNYVNNDSTIIKLTRLNERGSEKKPTGQFNFKCTTDWDEYFNFETGQWVTIIPNHPFKFPLIASWHQAFMRHANKVGNIPIENIDWETLKEINDELREELPPDPVIPFNLDDPRFDFTFSNKGTALDEELDLICNSVRVTMYKEGSMYRFSRDSSKPKIGNVTGRNVSIDSNIKNVKFSMPNTYDGVEIEFIDGNTDKSRFIHIPADQSAVRPKRLFLSGVTRYPYAWRRAHYEYLKLFSQRVGRTILTTKEAALWDLLDRITVYDHTRMVIKPLSESTGFFRQETEVQYKDGDWLVGSEKLIADGYMAMELNLDGLLTGSLGVVKNIPIDIHPDDPTRFKITLLPPATITEIMNQIRTVDGNNQIGERALVYPVSINNKQLEQDDYIILSKYPEGEMVRLELVRYNEDLYQYDNQLPPA